MGNLIHSKQSGFVKGRFIGEGIRCMEDIIGYADENNLCGLALQLDFEKAFDSVEWKFLLIVLEKIGFGTDFVQRIKTYYTNLFSSVENAGYTTDWFKVLRGVRQGYSLSSLLFILVVDILATNIRSKKEILGIQIGDREQNILQFADDTTCF